MGADGVMRDGITVPMNELIWKPAIIVMPQAGELELDLSNEDQAHHIAFMPGDGERQVLDLPARTRGRVRIHLDEPGLYWFGCAVSNHAGRGMLGFGHRPNAGDLRPRGRGNFERAAEFIAIPSPTGSTANNMSRYRGGGTDG
jgi:PQQ system protein